MSDHPSENVGFEASVVHSSFGRLRVHLPHWSGEGGDELIASLRQIGGVSHVEANPLTGNVLLLFQPGQVSEEALLEALKALRLETPVEVHEPGLTWETPASVPVVVEYASPSRDRKGALPYGRGSEMETAAGKDVYVTGWRRAAYHALGWASVGMAVIGAIVPGIPTSPFVILAGYFFIRSSPEAHQWLRQSRWFGPILRDWEDHRAIRRSVRNVALALIAGSMILTALIGLPAWLTVTIISLQTLGLAIVLSLRVVENVELEATPAS